MLNRKRKTKDPCLDCGLHKTLCICSLITSIELQTRVSLVIHAKELKRTTNTGRLALKALKSSAMFVRGESREALDLSELLDESYQPLFFYPAEGAQELTIDYLRLFTKPIHLIVPDGNWRQASKVHIRHPELAAIPRVMLPDTSRSVQFMRTESKPEGMATLQAIAYALKIIEGEIAFEHLHGIYQAKLNATLKGRPALQNKKAASSAALNTVSP